MPLIFKLLIIVTGLPLAMLAGAVLSVVIEDFIKDHKVDRK